MNINKIFSVSLIITITQHERIVHISIHNNIVVAFEMHARQFGLLFPISGKGEIYVQEREISIFLVQQYIKTIYILLRNIFVFFFFRFLLLNFSTIHFTQHFRFIQRNTIYAKKIDNFSEYLIPLGYTQTNCNVFDSLWRIIRTSEDKQNNFQLKHLKQNKKKSPKYICFVFLWYPRHSLNSPFLSLAPLLPPPHVADIVAGTMVPSMDETGPMRVINAGRTVPPTKQKIQHLKNTDSDALQ
eukprot:TRINITY_DN5448_c0_g3_i3.p1 TRINITY_DN5448_c0_g3~~TRINITY_DN5448_c0_g3_i3.p1  ORF type:complete len:242 (-),score=6.23 TRINITY_DN5448_c0_g3_i3:142-867(-)